MKTNHLEHLETRLEGMRHLLSHLHNEVASLDQKYSQVLLALQKIETEATADDLTGLSRRKSFFSRWTKLLRSCEQTGENCGILMIDIDHFKAVNDTHGHLTGDEVIKRIASLLKQYETPNCVVGRYGGEEFAVAIKGTDAEILGTAEMIRRSTEKLHGPVIGENGKPSNVEWKCTLSVGMASVHKAGFDAPRLLKLADDALYSAKESGRNRVCAA